MPNFARCVSSKPTILNQSRYACMWGLKHFPSGPKEHLHSLSFFIVKVLPLPPLVQVLSPRLASCQEALEALEHSRHLQLPC